MLGAENEIAEERQGSTHIVGTTNLYRRKVITTVVTIAVIAAVGLCVVFFWLTINSGTR